MNSLLDRIFGKLLDPALNAVARGLDRLWQRPVLDYDRTPDRRWTATGDFGGLIIRGTGATRRAAVVSCLRQATERDKYSGPI